jgi:hypothetical protein
MKDKLRRTIKERPIANTLVGAVSRWGGGLIPQNQAFVAPLIETDWAGWNRSGKLDPHIAYEERNIQHLANLIAIAAAFFLVSAAAGLYVAQGEKARLGSAGYVYDPDGYAPCRTAAVQVTSGGPGLCWWFSLQRI